MKEREQPSRDRLLGAVGLLAAVLGLVWFATHEEVDRSQPGTSPQVAGVVASAPTPAISRVAAASTGAVVQDPSWRRLSSTQRLALGPVEQVWPKLSESSRRRWLVIASSFQSKARASQDRMHARMAQWSKLSASERAEARLRYLQTAKIDAHSKRERWEAYKKAQASRAPLIEAAGDQIEVVPPLSVRAGPGATTMLMSQLLEGPQTTDPGSH